MDVKREVALSLRWLGCRTKTSALVPTLKIPGRLNANLLSDCYRFK
ncbi:hypothetical protein PMI26_05814 [Pseudomonas sp. GM33]|jgi:hypothetical protein|nr:hypothetical protein PMI26_05814 [Pseudomonas sp. GM33]